MKKRRIISMITAAAVIAVVLSLPAAVFGTESRMFRDDRIRVDFPDGTDVTECDSLADDSGDFTGFDKIAEAVLKDKRGTVDADIYFIADESADGDYYYLGSDTEDTDEYYLEYGEAAVGEMYSNIEGSELISLSNDGQYITDWYTFVKLTAEVKSGSGTHRESVYLTASSTDSYTISKAIVLSSADGALSSADMEDIAAPVIDDFFDYGYDGVMVGESFDDEYMSDDYDSSFDEGNMTNLLITVAIILSVAVAVTAAVKKKRGENSEVRSRGGMAAGTAVPHDGRRRMKPSGRPSPAKPSDSTVTQTGRKAESVRDRAAGPAEHIREKVRGASSSASENTGNSDNMGYSADGSDDRRYIDSLQTLYRSGLLTKKEMNEMIEKHSERKGAGE